MEKEVIMVRFLRKLINLNMWGGKHTESKNLLKSLPKHLRGEKVTNELFELTPGLPLREQAIAFLGIS